MTVACTARDQGRAGADRSSFEARRREACRAARPWREARKAADRRRSRALGLPHRRIEEWKYTDLRNALKEALPLGRRRRDARDARPTSIAALGPLAALDAHRIVFVDGALSRRAVERSMRRRRGRRRARWRRARAGDRSPASCCDVGDRGDDAVLALNTAFMTDGAVIDIAARRASSTKPLLLVFVRAGARGAPRRHAQRHQRRRRAPRRR